MMTKPLVNVEVQLTGKDGNAFVIIANVSRAIKLSDNPAKRELADKFRQEAMASGSYDEMLQVCMKYVDVV